MDSKKSLLLSIGIVCIVLLSIGFLAFRSFSQNQHPAFSSQKPQLYIISQEDNNPLDIVATTLPQFALSLADGKFSNLWQAYAQGKSDVIDATVTGGQDNTVIPTTTTFHNTQKQIVVAPQMQNKFKPGLYKLRVRLKTVTGKDITITQDFTWGVLAVNTGKAVYKPGETVKIGMGVLDNVGHTKCIAKGAITYDSAKVWLTIVSPSGKQQDLSTDEGTIVGSPECAATSITNNPDFQATLAAPSEIGKYTIHMTAENINGKHSIDDYFTVSSSDPDFDIMRTSYPTRIYPLGHYPVAITIVAHKDYSGTISDTVPANFLISNISQGGSTTTSGDSMYINWNVTLKAGQTYTFTYDIKFPLVSPEFYLVGPFTIGTAAEGREWQIASDAISLVQKNSNVADTGTSISATLPSAQSTNDLVIVVCADNGGARINTMATNGGNTWSSVSITSTPRQRVSYRVIKAGDSTTYTCTYQATGNVISIHVFEYAGLATSTVRDQSSTKNASCSGGTFTTNTITITNPVELIFVAVTATAPTFRNVNSNSAGYTTELVTNGSSAGTFMSADQSVSSIAGYSDTVTYSGNAGTCSGAIISFNTAINISQNGFQFFQNTNNVNPTNAIGSQNQNLTLPAPHYPFRMRVLLDIDGVNSLGLQTGDFIVSYATLSAGLTCATATYNPVGMPASGTDISFNPNGLGSQVAISATGSDPLDTGYTSVLESYYEDDYSSAGPTGGTSPGDITNSVSALSNSQAGLWDVSLMDNTSDTLANTYCLEITNADGTPLSTYVRIPTVTLFYNEINIQGPGNSGGTTVIQGPGNSGGTTFIK